jgi:group I intron endonuclease
MENKGIYKIVNLINGKFYIGSASSKGGFRKRWNEHRSGLKNGVHPNKHLQRAWVKYGEDNFRFEILEKLNDTSIILEREQYYINTLQPQYNICKIAGNTLGVRLSEKHKIILSNMAKLRVGDKNSFYGKTHTDEYKKESSNRMKGKFSGDKHPLFGKTHSDETKLKQSKAKKGKVSKRKSSIKQLDINDNLIKTWESISEASESLGLELKGCGNIVSCLKGRIKTAYGFKWEYNKLE